MLSAQELLFCIVFFGVFVIPLGGMLGGMCLRGCCALFNWFVGARMPLPAETPLKATVIEPGSNEPLEGAVEQQGNPYRSPLSVEPPTSLEEVPGDGVFIPTLGWSSFAAGLAAFAFSAVIVAAYLLLSAIGKTKQLSDLSVIQICLGAAIPAGSLTFFYVLLKGLPTTLPRAAIITLLTGVVIGAILAVLVPTILYVIAVATRP